jgi:hypothetical protein
MPGNYVRNPDDDEELKDFQTKVPRLRTSFYNFQAKQLTVEKFPWIII